MADHIEMIELTPAGSDLLQKLPLFSKLSFGETQELSAIAQLEQYESGKTIIEQDSLGAGLFVIRQGSAKVRRRDALSGELQDLATLGEGELFGEMSLIEDQLVSADVVAATQVEVLHIPRHDFERLIGANLGLAVKIYKSFLRTLSERLRKANARLAEADAKRK